MEGAQEVVRGNGREQERVDAIEHAAVRREEPAAVLHLHVALERRLEEVAEWRRDRDHEAEDDRLPDRQVVLSVERDEGDEDGRTGPEQEALPGLSRRERGCERRYRRFLFPTGLKTSSSIGRPSSAWTALSEEQKKKQPYSGDLFRVKTDIKGLEKAKFVG